MHTQFSQALAHLVNAYFIVTGEDAVLLSSDRVRYDGRMMMDHGHSVGHGRMVIGIQLVLYS